MTITIRPVEVRDIPAVRELLVETWHHTYDAIMGIEKVNEIISSWHSLERLEAQALSNASFLVAEEHALVGTSYAAREFEIVWLHRLYVKPNAQQRGIGYKLLEEAIQQTTPTCMRLEVEPKNLPALKFYERAGFRPLKSQSSCGGDSSLRALVMERTWPERATTTESTLPLG